VKASAVESKLPLAGSYGVVHVAQHNLTANQHIPTFLSSHAVKQGIK
jgi:hypothetical protein